MTIIQKTRTFDSLVLGVSSKVASYYCNLVCLLSTSSVGDNHESDNEIVRKIRFALPKTPYVKVEDVVQSLSSDRACDKIRVSEALVNHVTRKFADDWKSALGFFHWAALRPGCELSSSSYSKMVDLLGKMKQFDRMWELVNEMNSKSLITKETFSKISRRLVGAGKWEDAIEIFRGLESLGLEKNTDTMNILLETLCKESKVESAREVFLDLKDRISPDPFTFNIFVYGWCKARRIDEAEWTILEMKGHGFHPSVITYSTIIHAYCNQSNFYKAYSLLDKMESEGCSPNVVTYTGILNKLPDSQNIEVVHEISRRMKSAGIKPDILYFNCLIKVLGRAGRLLEASHIYDVEMPENGVSPNLCTYNTLISVSCHHSLKENALKILKDMELASCQPDLLTYIPLLKLCFKMGETGDSLDNLLDDMVNKHQLSLDSSSYALLIHGLCEAGKFERAFRLFEEMICQELPLRKRTYNLLLKEAEEKGMYKYIERVNDLMKNINHAGFENDKCKMYAV